MGKVLFDVLLPAIGRHYDFWVPDDMVMGDVCGLIAEAMQVAEPSFYCRSEGSSLLHVETGRIPLLRFTVEQLGFTDGERFVLL